VATTSPRVAPRCLQRGPTLVLELLDGPQEPEADSSREPPKPGGRATRSLSHYGAERRAGGTGEVSSGLLPEEAAEVAREELLG
jgi:hypothetical protein